MARMTDMRALREALAAQGFTVERARNGHYRVIAPTGAKCQIAATPSDWRGIRNTVSRLKRLGFDPAA
jgi:hypothetical protein